MEVFTFPSELKIVKKARFRHKILTKNWLIGGLAYSWYRVETSSYSVEVRNKVEKKIAEYQIKLDDINGYLNPHRSQLTLDLAFPSREYKSKTPRILEEAYERQKRINEIVTSIERSILS